MAHAVGWGIVVSRKVANTMKKLGSAVVCRGGRTARSWTVEPTDVRLSKESLALFFSLNSKGGGVTEVKVRVGVEDFPSILAAMITADRFRMLQELTNALKAEIDRQAEHDKAQVRAIRESVVDAANRAYNAAPVGRDHAERLTHDMVRQLVDELNKADDAPKEEDPSAA